MLIFKANENIMYIARDGGPGFAHSGLLAGSSGSCTSIVLPSVPCSDEQSDRLEKSLKVVLKDSRGIISSVLTRTKLFGKNCKCNEDAETLLQSASLCVTILFA